MLNRGSNVRAIRAGFDLAMLFVLAGLAFGENASVQKSATSFFGALLLVVLPLCQGRDWSPEMGPVIGPVIVRN